MKTLTKILFFGGFFLFFNLCRASATPVNNSQPENILRQQIYKSVDVTSTEWKNTPGSVDVDFIVGPDNQVKVVDVTGGNKALKKFVQEKLNGLQVSNNFANGRYTVKLNFKII